VTLKQLAAWVKVNRMIIHVSYLKRRDQYVVIAKKGPLYDLLRIENEDLGKALDQLKARVDEIYARRTS
jgi:hypothetical protein